MEQPGVVRVEAAVHEEHDYDGERARLDRSAAQTSADTDVRDTTRLGLRVVLSAVLDDGRQVSEENCVGLSGPPTMSVSEVRELLDRALGRDPDLRRPPRLAWGQLLSALKQAGVVTSDAELIAAPLELRLEPSARPMVTLD